MKRILLVEDDLSLINGLSFAVKKQGYQLDVAHTSSEADSLWEAGRYDLVILDVTLPDGSGFDICRNIRKTSKVPIMFLTAMDEETDIIMGLDIGGDDYITKPFKLAIFMSRINALLRRSDNFNQADTELNSNGIRVELLKGEVYKNNEQVELTANEYKLLRLFMENPNTVLSPEQIFNDMYDAVTVYMNRGAFSELCLANNVEESPVYYVRFSTDNGVAKRINDIKENYGLTDEIVDENTALLAITGASSNGYAQALYPLAAILFVLIVLAGVFMISSSMNSNVAQRTQFFGMMRCIGMSKQQITRYVRLEALNWCKTAIPIGIILGVVVTWVVCFGVKYGIGGEFAEIPLFYVSASGIVLGVAVGILTVLLAAHSPAKRAAKVSPAAAVSGNAQNGAKTRCTKIIGGMKIDTALGISHAVSARKNLILMTGSFALSIILFFGFSVGLDFAKALIPSTRSWQPDLSITSDDESNSVDKNLAAELSKVEGITQVYGNMALLDVPAVSEKGVSEITLVSYEEYMLQCAKENMVSGDLSKLSGDSNYVLTIYDARNPLETGDKVQVNGTELEVVGTVSEGLFEDDITLICTEETFERLMGDSDYALLNVQIADNVDKNKIVSSIRSMMSENYSLADYYDTNKDNNAEFWGIRLAVYVFLAIIILMAALNIINSTSMSVAAKTKQYGAMRAVGMDGRQLTKMITAEVLTYAAFGCVIGCAVGLYLNKTIYEAFITAYFGEIWHIPVREIAIILLFIFASVVMAVHAPAKRMRNMEITATINDM